MSKILQHIRKESSQEHKDNACRMIQNLAISDDSEYSVTITKYKANKTLEQLGYYFSTVVLVAAAWQGMPKEAAHEFLKKNCSTPVCFCALDGEEYKYFLSIKNMKIKEMANYIDDCINFLGSHGEYVPQPTYKR